VSRAAQAGDRAADWIIAQEDGDWSEANQAAFEAWLAESDGNKAAYWRLKHSWCEADRIGALGRSQAENSASETSQPPSRDLARRWWLAMSIAASIALMVGIGYERWQPLSAPAPAVAVQSFETPIGGRKVVALPDGSRVVLNTASHVHAAVDAQHREFWLDRGEAYFEVAHREETPFVVHAGNRRVTVLGTKFSVRRNGDNIAVTVLEGRVRVDEMEGALAVRSTIITGGDIARTSGAATLVTARSDERVADALAWREGMLNFDQARLSDIAAEFNRYNRRPIVVTDAEAGEMRIGGMFPANDPDAFARLLRDAYGLKVEETPDVIRISS
jgi:transmembrane sensor